jgi:hypothetical protein
LKRERDIDLDRAPVVLVERRLDSLTWMLCAALWVGLAAHQIKDKVGPSPWLSFALLIVASLRLIWEVLSALRPYRLTVDAECLRSERWYGARTWRWDEISNIRWRTNGRIEFTSDGGASGCRPDSSARPVGETSRSAKADWRS